MRVARYSACEVARYRWEPPVAAVCGVVSVAAIMPVFPAINSTYRHYRGTTTARYVFVGLSSKKISCAYAYCKLLARLART